MAHRRSARMQRTIACQNILRQIQSFLWHSDTFVSFTPGFTRGYDREPAGAGCNAAVPETTIGVECPNPILNLCIGKTFRSGL